MKRFGFIVSSVFVFIIFSSFGVVENNKYVKAKVEQHATKGLDLNQKVAFENHLIIEPKVIDIEKEPSTSVAQKVGSFVVSLFKRSFSTLVGFFVNLIK